jgi:hypothetical protein
VEWQQMMGIADADCCQCAISISLSSVFLMAQSQPWNKLDLKFSETNTEAIVTLGTLSMEWASIELVRLDMKLDTRRSIVH